jgi:hypothetical protein
MVIGIFRQEIVSFAPSGLMPRRGRNSRGFVTSAQMAPRRP